MTRAASNAKEFYPASRREESPEPTDDESSRVIARPDGYYWAADDGRQEFGPFTTAMEAVIAMRSGIETGLEPGETLAEAEVEIGFIEPVPTLPNDGMPEE